MLAFTRAHDGERILCVFNMSAGDATFTHPLVEKGKVLGLGCGNSSDKGETLNLGPFAARFGQSDASNASSTASIGSSTHLCRLR